MVSKGCRKIRQKQPVDADASIVVTSEQSIGYVKLGGHTWEGGRHLLADRLRGLFVSVSSIEDIHNMSRSSLVSSLETEVDLFKVLLCRLYESYLMFESEGSSTNLKKLGGYDVSLLNASIALKKAYRLRNSNLIIFRAAVVNSIQPVAEFEAHALNALAEQEVNIHWQGDTFGDNT